MGTSVVAACDCAEALLTSRIPDLKLYRFAIEVDRSDLEINTDCGNVRLGVFVVGKAGQQATLANTTISDQEKFEEKIILVVSRNVSHLDKMPF